MRIMYVTDALAIWGGVERILVDKANYLADHCGDDIFVVTANQGNHPVVFTLSENVYYQDLNIKFHLAYKYTGLNRIVKRLQLKRRFRRQVKALVTEIQPDAVVSVRPRLTNDLVRANLHVPIIYESHSSYKGQLVMDDSLTARLKNFYEYWRIRRVAHIVALTQGDACELRKLMPHVSVIPNGVNLYQGTDYATCDEKTVIFVGRLSKQKDIKSLLAIWAMVYKCHPDWQLHIYGGYGEEQDELLPQIEAQTDNIHVFPPTSEIMDCYRHSSMLVMTSVYEPFGLVLPEAMSCGIPVVAFDCPYGPADIITNGKDGFLVPPGDIQQFAERVCWLMGHPDKRQTMGQAGIASSQKYGADVIMPIWRKLFAEVVRRG